MLRNASLLVVRHRLVRRERQEKGLRFFALGGAVAPRGRSGKEHIHLSRNCKLRRSENTAIGSLKLIFKYTWAQLDTAIQGATEYLFS
jgi:hypothetical protein